MSLPTSDGSRSEWFGAEARTVGQVYVVFFSVHLVVLATGTEPAAAVRRAVPLDVPLVRLLSFAWVWIVLGMAATGGLVAVVSETGLGLGRPRRDDLPTVGLAVVGPILAWLAIVLVVNVGLGTSVTPTRSSGEFDAWYIWVTVVEPSVLVGIGYGLLVHGGVQSLVRDRLDATETILAVTTAGGFYHWIVDPPNAGSSQIGEWSHLGIVLLVLGLVLATSYAAVVLRRMHGTDTLADALSARRALVLGLGSLVWIVLAVDVLSGHHDAADLVVAAAWFGVFAVGAAARERTDSVWPAVFALVLFEVAMRLSPYVEATLGLTPA